MMIHVFLMLLNGVSNADIHFEDIKSYEVIIPKKVSIVEKETAGSSLPENEMSYSLPFSGKEHIIHLRKNIDVLGDVTISTSDKGFTPRKIDTREICYYHGYVEGVPNSQVRMTACSGRLSGLVKMNETWYEIVPLESSSTQQHVIYDLRNFQPKAGFCGVRDENHHFATATVVDPKATDTEQEVFPPAFVELFVVVDNRRYQILRASENAVTTDVTRIITLANDLYTDLNLKIMLSGLEIWTNMPEPFETGQKSLITPFTRYMNSVRKQRSNYDVAVLITGYQDRGILGLATLNGICTSQGTFTISATRDSPVQHALTLAHELGHSLNMAHDADGCVCKYRSGCVMARSSGNRKGFSECSKKTYSKTVEVKSCLKNVPKAKLQFNEPTCGNGILEHGEECDCGSFKDCSTNKCCNYKTCKLTSGSECAFGRCCKDCKLAAAGTICREIIEDCDLPEYCSGNSKYCPPNTFKADGTTCLDSSGYCYLGQCHTKEEQCKNVYGSDSVSSSDKCYNELNNNVNEYGHCGRSDNSFISCQNRSTLCGKLQCETDKNDNAVCTGVNVSISFDIVGAEMVADGTKCGLEQICMNTMCVPITRSSICDEQFTCNDNGVCNNNDHCHCNDGWAPPSCTTIGRGGSIDSGSPWTGSTSLLLIVLPVIGSLLFILICIICGGLIYRNYELQHRINIILLGLRGVSSLRRQGKDPIIMQAKISEAIMD